MSHSVRTVVLGVGIIFDCGSTQIYERVKGNYPIAPDDCYDSGISISLQHSLNPSHELMRPPEFQICETTLKGKSGTSSFTADRTTMTGKAYLCEVMLNDEYLLRHQILNSMIFYLLSYQLFTPIHCASFQIKDVTFLCIGRSGSGKSTLALAAMLRGHKVLAEDVCFIGGSSQLALHADCREIHVLPESLQFFPELSNMTLEPAHNGKLKYRVPMEDAEPLRINERIKVLFIEPDHAQPQSTICDCTDHDIYDELYFPKEEGFSLTSKARKKNVDWLRKQPAFIIRTGHNLENFFKMIQEIE